MAKESSKSSILSKQLFIILVVSCIAVIQAEYVDNDQLSSPSPSPSPNPDPSAKLIGPMDPLACIKSFIDSGVCVVDLGRKPSEACCKALKEIDETCWRRVFPIVNPFLAPLLSLCSDGGSIGGGAGAGGFPFPPLMPFPFPFPFGHPPPSPVVGAEGGAIPPPPSPVGGAGGGVVPPPPFFPFPFPKPVFKSPPPPVGGGVGGGAPATPDN